MTYKSRIKCCFSLNYCHFSVFLRWCCHVAIWPPCILRAQGIVAPAPFGQISLCWFWLDQSYCKKPYRQNCLWPGLCTRNAYRHSMPWLSSRFFLRDGNRTTFWSVADWLGTLQTSITCFLAANLTKLFRTRATITSHHCELLLHNDKANQLQFNKGNNCPLVYPWIYMISRGEAAREKLTLFMTVALDGKPLSDVQSNLDYPDLDYPDFSIIRTFSLVPFLHEY